MKTILILIGTRPEAIKLAPVALALRQAADKTRCLICATGQHRELLHQTLSLFNIAVDFDLDVMIENQTLAGLTSRLIIRLDALISETQPDWIVAQGDTTTVLAGALVAFYRRVPFAHVEAGLRTHDLDSPFPEEMNRIFADRISSWMFAPTWGARANLEAETLDHRRIRVTGNTVVDALQIISRCPYDWKNSPLSVVPQDATLVTVTAHRRESFGEAMQSIARAVRRIAEHFRLERVHIAFPVHPNPNVCRLMHESMSQMSNVSLLEPLDYVSMIQLMRRSSLILTDSGGVQEEAPSLGVPVLVMRDKTERPEGVDAGLVQLVGTNEDAIFRATLTALNQLQEGTEQACVQSPYGDGRATDRIVSALLEGECSEWEPADRLCNPERSLSGKTDTRS